MNQLLIKNLSSGGVITNYSCVSQCGHCLYNSGPHRSKNFLDKKRANKIFKCLSRFGCQAVHIGGGEPLMDSKKLMPVLAAAVEAGVAIDYVETNCAWFKDSGHASAVIKNLFKTGVHTLLISISPFHNEHIPYARVKGVIDACRSNGVKVFPWVDSFAGDLSRLDENKTHSLSEFEQVFGPNYLESIPEKYWIHMGGRALDTFRPVYPLQRVQHILVDSISSCSRVFSDTTHFHIDLYGNYIPGLCSGLAFPMEELGKPLDPGKYLLLEQLIFKGIRGLYNFACRNWGYIPNRKSYLNHCDLCTEIRYYLFNLDKDGKLFPELSPDGFYAEPRTD